MGGGDRAVVTRIDDRSTTERTPVEVSTKGNEKGEGLVCGVCSKPECSDGKHLSVAGNGAGLVA